MRVCIEKLTGKLIGSQSGGEVERLQKNEKISDKEYAEYLVDCDALEANRLDTLKQNAVNAGYKETDIEVKYVTDAKFQVIMDANKPEPTYADLRLSEYSSVSDLTVALWEDIVEGRPEARIALQKEREVIKLKYPKG